MIEIEVDGNGSHWGLTDLYDDFREDLFAALSGNDDFKVSWSSKKEILSAAIERKDGEVTVSAYASMDEVPDLLQGIIEDMSIPKSWSPFDELMEQELDCPTEAESHESLGKLEGSAEEQWTKISENINELADIADNQLEENYNALKKTVHDFLKYNN